MTNNPSLKLVRVRTAEPLCLELEYSDGLTARLDMSSILDGPLGEPLRAPAAFAEVAIDESGGSVAWPNEFDICPDVLRYWAQTGRVTSQEETDAYFAQAWGGAVLQTA